jgi:hypothetical protein
VIQSGVLGGGCFLATYSFPCLSMGYRTPQFEAVLVEKVAFHFSLLFAAQTTKKIVKM